MMDVGECICMWSCKKGKVKMKVNAVRKVNHYCFVFYKIIMRYGRFQMLK